jgi:hypothetical protein
MGALVERRGGRFARPFFVDGSKAPPPVDFRQVNFIMSPCLIKDLKSGETHAM